MSDLLSLWRSPLDRVALSCAESLLERQPRCSTFLDTNFDAMTIYNYGYYVANSDNDSDALTKMFGDMSGAITGIGGAAFIPQIGYTVDSSPGGFTVPDQCDILASGTGGNAPGTGGGPFYHFTIEGTGESGGPGNVLLSCAGDYTAGGKYFRSLAFFWQASSNPNDTCIAAGSFNCRAINCTFVDCPTAFYVTGSSCALQQCTVEYIKGPGSAVAVIIAGFQCGIFGPGEFAQTSQYSSGPATCTCVSIEYPAAHTLIANLHISDWNIGIDFSQGSGSQHTEIRNCEIQCDKNALNIELPADSAAATIGIKATSCTLSKTNNSPDAGAIVCINANGAQNDLLNDIALIDCTVFSQAKPQIAGQHGLEIAGGSNIKVIGGTYSNNGSGSGAGIAITAPCGDVQIIGANLQPDYSNSQHTYKQQYALLVTTTVLGTVQVSDCDMTAYPDGTSPVSVTAAQTSLFITNCAGYNDQGALLIATSAELAAGVSAATCSTPYFGPSIVTFSNPSPIEVVVFGQRLTMSFGVIALPSPYDAIAFTTSAPATFSWTGA